MRRRTTALLCLATLAAFLPAPVALADPTRPTADPTAGTAAGVTTLPGLPERIPQGQDGCTTRRGRDTSAAPWTRRALGLDQVWRLSRGRGTTVAVVGTGVSDAPAVLAGRVRALGAAGEDCVGRGTFQAGLVAGASRPGQGFSGVAPDARILAVRGTGARGEPDPARLAAAVEEAAEEGADVITVTAPLDGSDPAVRAAMAAAARHDSLVVVPAAADTEPRGGSAVPPAPVPPPGALAVVDTGPRGDRAAESPAYSRADLTAPGGSLVGPGPVGDGKWTASGSSLAAALTAGTAALVRSYHPDLSAAEVRERMLSGAYPGTVLPALDPYGAVSGVARPAAAAVPAGERPVALPKPSDTSGQRSTALLVVAVSVGVVVLVAFLAVVLPRGRARGWRPGRWETADRPGA
ncbi:S8 family serine peptidase [Streptomyces clavuligerus]|uniref:S8 family serine peptidase n=1 Tax=Streptomyces clavuligerus TaxID=1901 RepID=UPI00020D9607|nr:S8 family serine peptidase [Streptomyces clavuligerus]MBY6307862.1 S8 family serine peptidase [Streptomyces clavuligerus]WDN56307.1 S8 family serine peptidase [Streptomyces clavuligerus]